MTTKRTGGADGERDGGADPQVIEPTRGRVLQKRAPGRRWTATQTAEFFSHLAATCNATASAAAAGLSFSQVYGRRRKDEVFAESWRQALTLGYERLEEELLRLTLAGLTRAADGAWDAEREPPRPGAGLPRKADGSPDMQMALALLNRHRATVEHGGKGARAGRLATPEETDALLRKKLDALAKRLKSTEA